MTFTQKSGIGSRSPSFTPHSLKDLQSERNEDSAPQHLKADVAAQVATGRPIGTRIRSSRIVPMGAAAVPLGAAAAHRRIHASPCAHCPSAHFAPDPESLDLLRAPRLVQVARAFPCAWRPSALCRGYSDTVALVHSDVADGQVERARADLGRVSK